MGLLNLLTAYQKKHLVEFLPYHECDTQSRQAPDLECLIKLQAQHTQQRHLIFLTGTDIKSCRFSDKKNLQDKTLTIYSKTVGPNIVLFNLSFVCSCLFSERPFEMFLQYSRNGIVIGSIDDVMSGFHSLIGSINQNELPTPPSTGG